MEDHLKTLAEEWASHFASAIQHLTGDQVRTSLSTDETLESNPDSIFWKQSTDVIPPAALVVSSHSGVWKWLGARVLAAKGTLEPGQPEIRSAFHEVLRIAALPMEKTISGLAGRAIHFTDALEIESPPPPLSSVAVRLSIEGQWNEALHLSFSGAWHEVIEPTVGTVEQIHNRGEEWRKASKGSQTSDLLLEVELPVGVSFGRTQMRLRDAVKLTTGSIVELNRSASQPVEVVINNCVIARGEVVVVEGNYGVRILEIVSREERLRTLF